MEFILFWRQPRKSASSRILVRWELLLLTMSCLAIFSNSCFAEGGIFTADQYVGCFRENTIRQERPIIVLKHPSMTIEICLENCRSAGTYTFSRIENGTICSCYEIYDVQILDNRCNATCAGNKLQYCGSFVKESDSRSMYSLYAVCPIGYYGAGCDGVCHCKRQVPCNRTTGICPDGCDGNYTGTTCSSTNLNLQYIGCYGDQEIRALDTYPPNAFNRDDNSVDNCIATCLVHNSSYAGTQYSYQCFCGESFDKYGKLSETNCYRKCSGNQSETCGGDYANSVYSVCPTGNFGQNCTNRCHCFNDNRCTFENGTCPNSQCKPAWKGDACDLRDCSVNNGDCEESETCSVVDLIFTQLDLCRCSDGFQRNQLWASCLDIDECSDDLAACGENDANCTNTVGGYYCKCTTGESKYKSSCSSPATSGSVDNSSSINTGNTPLIIGVVVGSVGGLVVILLVIGISIYCRRKRKPKLSGNRTGLSVSPKSPNDDDQDKDGTENTDPVYDEIEETKTTSLSNENEHHYTKLQSNSAKLPSE